MARSKKRVLKPVPLPATITYTTTTTAAPASSSAEIALADPAPSTAELRRRRPGTAGPTVSPRAPENAAEAKKRSRGQGRVDDGGGDDGEDSDMPWTARSQWMVYAVASGACAALNGVFAKLTTNDLTSQIARGVSGFFGAEGSARVLEVIVRCIFFGLNLLFNGVMWTLFTKALARGTSTTQVSVMNTSTNFVVTALLGLAVFAERLPPLWWAGAALLVAGNVIIGRKDEGDGSADGDGGDAEEEGAQGADGADGDVAERGRVGVAATEYKDEDEDEDVPLIGDLDGPPHGS
ncbi:hypothetical protein F4802DRAFT_34162 [Xylaria palmicola]|nr:hypothetical protein F4802DRAFT_34162 [Xylaria palmicola]